MHRHRPHCASLLACAALFALCTPARARADQAERALPRSVSGQAGLGLDGDGLFAMRLGIDAQPIAVGSTLLLGARLTYGDSSGWFSGGSHTFIAAAPSVTFTDFGRAAAMLAFGVGPAYIEDRTQRPLFSDDPVKKQTRFGVVASGSLGVVFRAKQFSCAPQLVFEGGSIPFAVTLQVAVGVSDGPAGTR